ncbi:hypothetical protein BZA77DRAFT_325189, partial [Pyronema omphalodes]
MPKLPLTPLISALLLLFSPGDTSTGMKISLPSDFMNPPHNYSSALRSSVPRGCRRYGNLPRFSTTNLQKIWRLKYCDRGSAGY